MLVGWSKVLDYQLDWSLSKGQSTIRVAFALYQTKNSMREPVPFCFNISESLSIIGRSVLYEYLLTLEYKTQEGVNYVLAKFSQIRQPG